MVDFWESLRLVFSSVITQFWWWLAAAIPGVAAVYYPWIRPLLPEKFLSHLPRILQQETPIIDTKILVAVLVALAFLSFIQTFHELRITKDKALTDASQKLASLQQQLDDREKKKTIRVKLSALLEEGRQLMNRCGDETKPPPNADADDWAQRTEAVLRDNLDESYVARFRSGAGLPLTANSISSIPHRQLWGALWVRTSRLQEFLSELGS